jgi:predicted phosphohydrolase
MKIQYCSDLHLEFDANRDYLDQHPISPFGDILILAGDIVPFSAIKRANYFFDKVSELFDSVYWVPGNHEYYHGDMAGHTGSFIKSIRPNVHLVNNQVIESGEIRIICSTMWTKISALNSYRITSSMNDFRVIDAGIHILNADDYNSLYTENLSFLTNELSKNFNGKTIVATHHVPTFINYPAEYMGSVLNEAFAVELSELIHETKPDYWIFGHHHRNIEPFVIGETRLLTNQLGYLQSGEHVGFDTSKVIELM